MSFQAWILINEAQNTFALPVVQLREEYCVILRLVLMPKKYVETLRRLIIYSKEELNIYSRWGKCNPINWKCVSWRLSVVKNVVINVGCKCNG
jgi:hypothetical protein